MELSLPRWKHLQDKPICDATEGDLLDLLSNRIFVAAKQEAWRRILELRHTNPNGRDRNQVVDELLTARGIEIAFEIFESFSPTKKSNEKK